MLDQRWMRRAGAGGLSQMATELDFGEAQRAGLAAATMGTAAVHPFQAFARGVLAQSDLRARITEAYRRPEEDCLPSLTAEATLPEAVRVRVEATARGLVEALRATGSHGGVESLMREFALSSQERRAWR
jgi:RHH-type proline utilization regulon transcriptional repressor/proline dehydrogenase/delta 1-pyrroline-5-carboxylate dehydrogenase